MRKILKFLGILSLSAVALCSCDLIPLIPSDDPSEESITDFDFVKDEKLVLDESSDTPFYLLTLTSGEDYQIRTNIDDKLSDKYELKYTKADDFTDITLTENGAITALEVERFSVGSVTAKLYKKGSTKVIKSHYTIVKVLAEQTEWAEATINDQTLDYNSETQTYTLNVTAGDQYAIALNTRSNVSLTKEFSLSNSAFGDFMSVSNTGLVKTVSTITEAKQGKVDIVLKSASTNKTLYTLYLLVNITPQEKPENVMEVKDASSGNAIVEGQTINLRVGDSITLQVKFNNSLKYNVLSTTSELVEITQDTNTITAKGAGEAPIHVEYEDKTLNFVLNISTNNVVRLYTENGGDDFVIHNGVLHILGQFLVVYESGRVAEIDSNDVTNVVTDLNATHKSVKFSFKENGVVVEVTYSVRFFVTEAYEPRFTAFTFQDYGTKNGYYGNIHYLNAQGNLKLLVIPVWFTNSSEFFTEAQKTQIREDIEEKILSDKTEDNYWSVKSFYETESKGRLSIDATIADWYISETSTTSYDDINTDSTHILVKNAVADYFEKNPTDSISNYDADNDGRVDSAIVYYASNFYGTRSGTQRSTAFEFSLPDRIDANYDNGIFCSIGGIYGFTKTTNTSWQLEASDLSSLFPTSFKRGSNHIIHEVGHQFGAIDLYEYNAVQDEKTYPAGRFSMQDNDMGSHDPYQQNLIGWSRPQVYASSDYSIGDKITIAVDDFQSSGNNIILTNKWNSYNSLFDEYLILELFTPTGLNEFDAKTRNLNEAGFRLWHVDSLIRDLTEGNDENPYYTSDLNKYGQLVYKSSNFDKDNPFDICHFIRNNEEESYSAKSSMVTSDLFQAGEMFSMSRFASQFEKGENLNSNEKLGWEFTIESIYKKTDGNYSGIITLQRVDNTRTEYSAKATMVDADQPEGVDYVDYTSNLFPNDEFVHIALATNEGTALSYMGYQNDKIISQRGITLLGALNGNGGAIRISTGGNTEFSAIIKKVSIVYSIMTNAKLSANANGQALEGTRFDGPRSVEAGDDYNDIGVTYKVNDQFIVLQNATSFSSITHTSDILILSINVEYSLIRVK